MELPSEYLKRLIAENGGAISVERFMQEALYHPQFGYYANRIVKIGPDGDFSTSATLHDAVPLAMCRWAAYHRREAIQNGRWHVIELGGGGGQIAEGILRGLGWFIRRGLNYHIVEVSNPLRDLQKQRLKSFGERVCWHREISSALQTAGGSALIISNEFVDAFPCVQLSKDNTAQSGWREVRMSWPDSASAACLTLTDWNPGDNAWSEWKSFSDSVPSSFTNRQKLEIHFSYLRWLQSWSESWKHGRMLTIDYGDAFPSLYLRRKNGTLRSYLHHQRVEGEAVFRNFGRQDLTADVNFTDLQRWGAQLGAETTAFGTQTQFLRKHLPAKWLLSHERDDPALQFLLDEAGAGSAFKVLEQCKLSSEH